MLQYIIDSGREVDNTEIVHLTEMLMRQLLKLDGIEAEGEGRVQRKTEVRRIQIIVETLDTLKSRNSNYSSRNVSVASYWRASEPLPSASPSPTSSPSPASLVLPFSSLALSPPPSSSSHTEPCLMPSNIPQPTYPAVPHFPPSTHPYSSFPGYPHLAASPTPYLTPDFHHPYQYYDPSQTTYFTPYSVPSPAPAPAPAPAPYQDGSSYMHHPSNPFSMPSTTVTQNWEHFG